MGCYIFVAYLFSRESQNGPVHITVCKSQAGYSYRTIIDTNASNEWLPLKITASQMGFMWVLNYNTHLS